MIFEEVEGLADRNAGFPRNYGPISLPAFQGERGFHHVLIPSNPAAQMATVSAEQLFSGTMGDTSPKSALGPRTKQSRDYADIDIIKIAGAREQRNALVIIDTGIAFWNKAFRTNREDPDTCIFDAVGYVQFEPGGLSTKVLSSQELVDICAIADGPGGQREVLQILGERCGETVYGQNISPQTVTHGTAMAHQALEPVMKENSIDGSKLGEVPPLVVGMELPYAAVIDSSGSTLQAILPRILVEAEKIVETTVGEWYTPLIHFVLAFGSTGGDHTSSNPLSAHIAKGFGPHAEALYVPMGNHRQEQLHARLGNDDSVGWLLPDGDRTSNTIVLTGAKPLGALRLTAPGMAEAVLGPKIAGLWVLQSDGQVIGNADYRTDGEKWSCWLSLAGTHPMSGLPRPNAGIWDLSVNSTGIVNAWILRDDHPTVGETGPMSLQSQFVHPNYKAKTPYGAFEMGDTADSPIKRAGSASVLSGLGLDSIVSVEAQQHTMMGRVETAWYSGLSMDGTNTGVEHMLVDHDRPSGGTLCLVNGSDHKQKMSGTSIAAAKVAGSRVFS